MEKLELKEIVGYLPYGLQWQLQNDISEDFSEYDYDSPAIFEKGAIWDLIGYADGSYNIPMGEGEVNGFIFGNGTFYANIGPSLIKPILRPISDLTKSEFSLYNNLYGLCKSEIMATSFYNLPHGLIISLCEKHVDIHNLIDRKLAIDINKI